MIHIVFRAVFLLALGSSCSFQLWSILGGKVMANHHTSLILPFAIWRNVPLTVRLSRVWTSMMSLLQLIFIASWMEKKALTGIVITEHHQLQEI